MTKYYNYTFTYYGNPITISKAVTDSMEERPAHKRGYAAGWMLEQIRSYTGDKNFPGIPGWFLLEVPKKGTIKLADTFKAMDDSKAWFRSLTPEEVERLFR